MCHFDDIKHLSPETIDPDWLSPVKVVAQVLEADRAAHSQQRAGAADAEGEAQAKADDRASAPQPVAAQDSAANGAVHTLSEPDIAAWLAARRVEVSGWSLESIVGTAAVARARRERERTSG